MNGKYALLGTDTAWGRFEISRGRVERSRLERTLREFEGNAGRLNLDSDAVALAAEIAALEPVLDDDARIALILLVLAALAAVEEGSTRFPATGKTAAAPMAATIAALVGGGASARERERAAANIGKLLDSNSAASVIGRSEDDFRPLLFLRPWIYVHRILAAERALATRLAALLKNAPSIRANAAAITKALGEVTAKPPVPNAGALQLTREQCEAIRAAADSRLAVISGGPGTGKTSVVAAILRVLARLGVEPGDIALAAPTGKAAFRMKAAVFEALSQIRGPAPADAALLAARPDAATIHRLLGYSPESGRFRHHRNNPISASVVIVDESSMLDLALMERLAGALRDDARLVLLGDANQLPSVAAGAVLRDLLAACESGERAAAKAMSGVVLSRNFRASGAGGAAISAAAEAINAGDAEFTGCAPARRESAAEVKFEGVEVIASGSGVLGAFLDRWHRERLFDTPKVGAELDAELAEGDGGFAGADLERLRRVFDHFSRARILCITRQFAGGAERINEWMHERTAARQAGRRWTRSRFFPGEPLMVLRNDYERGLFNGDQGVALTVRRAGADGAAAMAVFARGENFAAFPIEMLADRLELCYAMTVHKAQGSEFDTVAVVLPEKPLAMMTREILYTAVTRSRKSVVLIGAEERLREAIGRASERFSGLLERLRAAIEG
jgi:exodeoxyribonuclease V alpha subunit